MLEPILFFFLGAVAIASAVGMIASRSPINSALWLVLNFFCIASFYLMLNAQFIGVIQILVYAGAIMVLFLFVIMLLNLDTLPSLKAFNWRKGVAFVLGIAVLAQLIFVLVAGLGALPDPVPALDAAQQGGAEAIGRVLFTQYVFPLEIIGILLLAATIGAVLLAKKKLV